MMANYLHKPKSNKKYTKKIFADDEFRRNKYYAWLKHKAQANHRGEYYDLTFQDWETLWPDELFALRGRRPDDLCLMRIDIDGGWTVSNLEIVTRIDYLVRAREYRR